MKRKIKKIKKNKCVIALIKLTGGGVLAPLIPSSGCVFSGLKFRLLLASSFIKVSSLQVVFFIVSLTLPLTLFSFEKDFPPYPNGKFPPVCKIHPLKAVSESDRNKGSFKSTYKNQDKGLKLTLQLDMNYHKNSSGVHVSLKDTLGKSLVHSVKVGGHPNDIGQVYWAYLNKDDRKDYIITMSGGDGYLSGGRQKATFLLSRKVSTSDPKRQAYSSKSIGVYSLRQQDFYDYSTDNKCEFLHQSLVNDGQNNYWVYNVLQFIDGNIVMKNGLSRFFPKWIKLTAAASDKSAPLTPTKKSQLTKKYIRQMGAALK